MESNKVSLIESQIPIKAIPEDQLNVFLKTEFKAWLAVLLDIKAENEEKLNNALLGVKKHFWSIGIKEIRKAFTMYADSELSYSLKDGSIALKPISNYISRVLVGQIFYEYNLQKPTKKRKPEGVLQLPDADKRNNEILSAVICFDYYIQNGYLNDGSLYLYKVLLHQFEFTDEEKQAMITLSKEKDCTIEEKRIYYKELCLRRFFDKIHAKGKHIKDFI